MGLCASAVEANPRKVVPVHHHSEEERQAKIDNAEDSNSEHCIGCMKAFLKEDLETSECCSHLLCKDCKAPPGRKLCSVCAHNAKAGAELAKVIPREDTQGMVDDDGIDDMGTGEQGGLLFEDALTKNDFQASVNQKKLEFGKECPSCKERCNPNTFKTPKCCNRAMCPACTLGKDVEDGKCKLCETEAEDQDAPTF